MSNKKYAKRIKRNQEKNGLKNGEYVVKNINDNRYEFECEGMDAVSKLVTISMALRDAQEFLDEIHKKQPKVDICPLVMQRNSAKHVCED